MSEYVKLTVEEMIGEKFGELLVISKNESESKRTSQVMLNCECSCGNKNVIVPRFKLLSGKTKNCGKCDLFKLKDQIVGDFKVVEKNEKLSAIRHTTLWNCKCTKCGYIRVYSSTEINRAIKEGTGLHCATCEKVSRRSNAINEMMHRKYFGKLEVLEYDNENSSSLEDTYICKCQCGKIVHGVKGDNLRRGVSQSCGCSRYDKLQNKDLSKFNPLVIDNSKSTISNVTINDALSYDDFKQYNMYDKSINEEEIMEEKYYRSMLRQQYIKLIGRTCDKDNPMYDYYGAAGRGVSKEWVSNFDVFYNDVLEMYKAAEKMYPGEILYIDRIDNSTGYSATNVRFVPNVTNSNNSDNNANIVYKDQTWSYSMLARAYGNVAGVSASTLRNRIHAGWSIDDALYTPVATYEETPDTKIQRLPISPIYQISDVEAEHKASQGINRYDIDYSYNPPTNKFDLVNSKDISKTKRDIINYNKEHKLFSYLRDLGRNKENK